MSGGATATHVVWGEFPAADAMLEALATLRAEHVRELETHTPRHVEGATVPGPPSRLWLAAPSGGALAVGALFTAIAHLGHPVELAALLLVTPLAALTAAVALFSALALKLRQQRGKPSVPAGGSDGFWISVTTRVPEDAERARARFEALGAKRVTTRTEGVA